MIQSTTTSLAARRLNYFFSFGFFSLLLLVVRDERRSSFRSNKRTEPKIMMSYEDGSSFSLCVCSQQKTDHISKKAMIILEKGRSCRQSWDRVSTDRYSVARRFFRFSFSCAVGPIFSPLFRISSVIQPVVGVCVCVCVSSSKWRCGSRLKIGCGMRRDRN